MRGKQMQVIEEPIFVPVIGLGLKCDGRKVKAVYRAPEREPLDFRAADGYVRTTVTGVKGYALVVFEHE